MTDAPAPASRPKPFLRKGTKVEVRNRFDGSWAQGFEVAGREDGHYLVTRLSDGEILPAAFEVDDVRRERVRQTWWV